MGLIKDPFTRQHEEKKADTFTIRLNDKEREQLNKDKKKIKQIKDSTAMKQLATIGSIVLHDKKMSMILDVLLGNSKRNDRTGVIDEEFD